MTIHIDFAPPGAPAGAAVIGIHTGRRPTPAALTLDGAGWLARAMEAARFTGASGQSLVAMAPAALPACSRVVVLGLGDPAALDGKVARALGGAVAAALLYSGEQRADVALDIDDALAAEVAMGLALRAHRPLAAYRTRLEADEQPSLTQVTIRTADPDAASAAWGRRRPVAEGAILARELTALPGNVLTPKAFVARAQALEAEGLTVEVLKEKDLARLGLNLLLAVGRASANRPSLCLVRWQGAADAAAAPVALVGKGITFDTGGISLKRSETMHEMKGDMAGAAAALGTVRALAGRGARVNAVAVLALAENMPGAEATRPGDIVRSFAGQTVEIIDTDAEGRLVLADALAYARQVLKPCAMVDLATLTGAVITTLGRHHAGLFSPDDALAGQLAAAGAETGERLWRLPLLEALDEDLKSEAADMVNCASDSYLPDALHAARFLARFVEGEGAPPWAHLDIAGVSETPEDTSLAAKGPTGFGVLLLDRWIAGSFEG